MKKVLFLFGVLLTIAFTGCNKTDDRDQFVGTYSLSATGSISFYAYGDSYTIPLNGNDDIIITKSSADNMVHVSGFYEADAEVSGNTIQIDTEIGTINDPEGTISLTLHHKRGTLSGTTLTFSTDVTGNVYYQGYTFPASGSINNIAYKK